MVSLGQLYAAILAALLLGVLCVSIPVLRGIVREGRERRRQRRAGEPDHETDDEASDRVPSPPLEGETTGRRRATCRQCGAENDPQFTYCRRCATPL